jgi:hypothetical protein
VQAVAGSATTNQGEAGEIVVNFNRPMAGMKGVILRVISNDAVEPEQTLTLRFEVTE